jgi:hypothetical protein
MDRNELPLGPRNLGVLLGASKTIYVPMVVWCKPCTYLAPTLAMSPNGLKREFAWPTSTRSSIGCVQNDFWAQGTFSANHAPIVYQDKRFLQMDRIKHPVEPPHHGVPSGASKMISEPMVCLVQTVHLSYIDLQCLQIEQNEIPHDPRHLGVPSGASKMIFLSLWYVWPKLCTYLVLILALSPNGLYPRDPRHLGIASSSSKKIFELLVRLAQSIHLSCTNTNTISKQTESRFHMTLIT